MLDVSWRQEMILKIGWLYDVEGIQVMDAIRKGWKIEM